MTANKVATTLVILVLIAAAIYFAYTQGWLTDSKPQSSKPKATPSTSQTPITTPVIQKTTNINLNGYTYTGAPVISEDGMYSMVCLTSPGNLAIACPTFVYVNSDGTLADTYTDSYGNVKSNGDRYNYYQQYLNPQGRRVCCYRKSNLITLNTYKLQISSPITTQEFAQDTQL